MKVMSTEPAEEARTGLSLAGQRAWGKALVKTGTEHLDLGMVLQGKQALKEAEAATPPKP